MINIQKYKIILASKSPRRQELLKGLGVDFEIYTIDGIEENYPKELTKEEIPVYLSKIKSTAHADILKENDAGATQGKAFWSEVADGLAGQVRWETEHPYLLKEKSQP